MRLSVLAVTLAALGVAGCQTAATYTPAIDTRTSRGGGANYNRDLYECRQIALGRDVGTQAGERALQGGAAGAVVGGVAGSLDGNFGEGALIGAGTGIALGALLGGIEATEAQKNILRNCMRGRGYTVLE